MLYRLPHTLNLQNPEKYKTMHGISINIQHIYIQSRITFLRTECNISNLYSHILLFQSYCEQETHHKDIQGKKLLGDQILDKTNTFFVRFVSL